MKYKIKQGDKVRRLIYSYIFKYPGLNRTNLSKKIGISYSTLKYHLNHLIKQELIVEKKVHKNNRYYAKNTIGAYEKKILNILREDTPRAIILYIDAYISPTLNELASFCNNFDIMVKM